MKEYIDSINWSEVWEFSKQFILPNIGWFIFWIVLFIVLGIILGIVFNVFLYRKNFFERDKKYYNWIAKLWIPYFMIVILYFMTMIGLFYGTHSILRNENKNIAAQIYSNTFGTTFSSEKEKKDFLHAVQMLSNSSDDASKSMTKAFAVYIKQNNSGLSALDNFKNSSTSYLLQKYESDVYSACIYGFMKAVDDKADMKNVKNIDYAEFKSTLAKLDQIEPQKIELSLQSEMGRKLQSVQDFVFHEILKHELLFFLLFLLIPFVEFLIYIKFVKTPNAVQNSASA
ncbi:cytochrome c oxidase subunit II [Flavobacterium branchiicola]|uniref:Chloride channel protein n=1 Tax=Flavobacterium branchiicola TaxID=1114875 RepID=A0ABV9PFT9_9FLAO|nr:chloride channel protein [Flavobacterium branchiicola]MBS7254675.1 chloride channel protein [Flavobacterium branchiicola]